MVNDIVVEVGNARYQALVDDYVNGGTVDEYALAEAWLNTTVPNQQLDAVLYLGPASREAIAPSAEPCKRPGFLDERLRRIALTGIPKFEAENIQKLCGG